jgi:hypothetical protein
MEVHLSNKPGILQMHLSKWPCSSQRIVCLGNKLERMKLHRSALFVMAGQKQREVYLQQVKPLQEDGHAAENGRR